MIVFVKTVEEAARRLAELDGELWAGGTDLHERREHLGAAERARPLVDLRDVPGLDGIASAGDGAWIGARATLREVAEHAELRAGWPGVSEAAGALANPQIRAVGTVGGNLMQAPRCWYYRHPEYRCLRRGGSTCFAREGDHLLHVCFDRAPCAAPHPSTLGMALLAYEAEVEFVAAEADGPAGPPQRRGVAEVLALGGLPAAAVISAVRLGPPRAGERSAYVRASNRALAEWALVEVTVRLTLDGAGRVSFARVAAGAVAPTPLRLEGVEAALLGRPVDGESLVAAAGRATEGARALPDTRYKFELLEGAVLTALEQAVAEPSATREPLPSAIEESR